GLVVENCRPVAPLAHRLQCRLIEERITADNLQRLDRSVRRNHGSEFNASRSANLPRQRWIYGLYTMDQHGGIDARVNDQRPFATRLADDRALRAGGRDVDATWARDQ